VCVCVYVCMYVCIEIIMMTETDTDVLYDVILH
jgi:hypothetical protein